MRRPYPNPDAVPYASTQPAGFPCQMTTQDTGRMYPVHQHGAFLNPAGTGNTDVSSGHFHRVSEFRVQPDPSDGHTHQLTMLPCGWGAAQTTGRDGPMPQFQLGDGGTELAPMQQRMAALVPKISMLPWIVGAVVVSGLVIGGVILLSRSDS